MSEKTSTNRPEALVAVDTKFDSLRAALAPLLSTLSAEQQASLSAVLDEEIDRTHQAIVTQVQELTDHPVSASTAIPKPSAEIFDDLIYQKKLQDLQAFASNIKYAAAKNLPRDTDWVRTFEYYKHKLGKFFKVAFIHADNQTNGQKWLQAILIQEFDQYDKHACNKEIGDNVLPLRMHDGQIEAAITLRNPPGSFGQTVFVTPRCSNSNPIKPVFCDVPNPLWKKHQRLDANRMTGKVSNKVVFIDENLEKQIDQTQEKIVWFSIPELKRLLDEPQMEDSATITLIQWVLLNASHLQHEFQSAK